MVRLKLAHPHPHPHKHQHTSTNRGAHPHPPPPPPLTSINIPQPTCWPTPTPPLTSINRPQPTGWPTPTPPHTSINIPQPTGVLTPSPLLSTPPLKTSQTSTNLGQQVRSVESSEGSLFRWLHHHHVPCSQGRAKLPSLHQQWEVPGDDLPDHAHWLTSGVVKVGTICNMQ